MTGSLTPSAAESDPAALLRAKLLAAVEKWRDRARGKIFKLKQAAADTARADELRLFGETLKMHLAEIPRGAESVTLPNMFGGPDLVIPLEKAKSPAENMRAVFKQYHKAFRGQEEVARRSAAEEKSLVRMAGIDGEIAAADLASLREIEVRLQSAGLFPRPVKMQEIVRSEKKGPKHFVSGDGLDILVGRNAVENEDLSLRLARGNDGWFHAEDRAGAHVVVRVPTGKELPQETILDAATLAAYHSKLRGRPVAEVTWTLAKFVTRAKHAPAGTVIVQKGKTIRLKIEPARLERLMEPARRLGEE
ncbi:MAG: NFACT RNA binding domain-containing protein [Planctomycetes bacterium]|nr:NFACT RNA binding domain-containing protein [Planctomycetota bacterium]